MNRGGHAHAHGINGHSAPVACDEQALSQQLVLFAAKENGKVAAPAATLGSSQPTVKRSTGVIVMLVLVIGIAKFESLVYFFFRSQSSIPGPSAVLLGTYVLSKQ